MSMAEVLTSARDAGVSVAVDGGDLLVAVFVLPRCKRGLDTFVGVGANLRAGQLGTWFCGACKASAVLS
jgi:hypothetical protein